MKKIICLIAMALFTATGCTSVEMNQTKTDTPDDNTQGKATTLSCADYTLNPLWNWAETPANQLIVIRSQAELADFIFPNDKLPEDIDFEKNTLLLVAGQATNGIESVKKNFVKTRTNKGPSSLSSIMRFTVINQSLSHRKGAGRGFANEQRIVQKRKQIPDKSGRSVR